MVCKFYLNKEREKEREVDTLPTTEYARKECIKVQ